MSALHSYKSLPPEEEFDRRKALVVTQDDNTLERQREHDLKLDAILEEREQCMKAACDHAGAIGLVYNAAENNYYRIAAEQESVEMPPVPEPPAPPKVAAPPRLGHEARQKAGKRSKFLDYLGWFLSIPVGVFVGYGLATLTGLPIQRYPAYLIAGVLVGIAAIVSMKLVFDKLWRHVGKQKAMGRSYGWLLAFAFVLTGLLMMVEAWLGAQALVFYSKRVVFDAKDALQIGTAFPLAIAISTATLLISAIGGYIHGAESLTEHDEEVRDYEFQVKAHEKELERSQAEYRERLARWEENKRALAQSHQDRLARIDSEKQEMDDFRKSADFQALLKYIGRVNALNMLIEEAKA